MYKFKAKIDIIGVNPFVFVPGKILNGIFKLSGKEKGHIPIRGTINGKSYRQTLVKYSGNWRLYVNTTMLKDSPKRIGEKIEITIDIDRESREIKPPRIFIQSLNKNKKAKKVFNSLSSSRKLEIVRYLSNLKTEESLNKNIKRAIGFLLGTERFVGREKP